MSLENTENKNKADLFKMLFEKQQTEMEEWKKKTCRHWYIGGGRDDDGKWYGNCKHCGHHRSPNYRDNQSDNDEDEQHDDDYIDMDSYDPLQYYQGDSDY